jgi:hypothetical protein
MRQVDGAGIDQAQDQHSERLSPVVAQVDMTG